MRSRLQQRAHGDAGIVAVVVALCVSTFMIGFAALAVDLGTAYTARATLRSVADRVAVATAAALPQVQGPDGALAAFRTAFHATCRDGTGLWDAGTCDPSSTLPWATDGNRANGEVEFVATPNGGLSFALPPLPSTMPAQAGAVRVALPPARVELGLSSYLGKDSVDVRQAASARIGTPLGMGILPIPLTATDVANGQFCLQDPAVPPAPVQTYPPPATTAQSPGLRITAPADATVPIDPDGSPSTLRLSLALQNLNWDAKNLQVWISTHPTPLTPASAQRLLLVDGWVSFDTLVEIPRHAPGSSVTIWMTGSQRWILSGSYQPFTSAPVTLAYAGRPAPDVDPCTLPQASTRGITPIARTEAGAMLARNVRGGPQVQLYPSAQLAGLLDPLGDLCAVDIVVPATGCLTSDAAPGFHDALRAGLMTSGDGLRGRLIGDCGGGTTTSGGYSGIDASRLLSSRSPHLDTSFGSSTQLREQIITGQAPPAGRGWVTSGALRCPRMAVLPVLADSPATPALAALGGRQVTGFVYVWIDGVSSDRGLEWNGSSLRAVSGYVIDPRYLPAVVAGSGTVGPYLGGDMPKEAMLICDLIDRAAGRCAT